MIVDTIKPTDIPALRALWREAFGDSDALIDLFFIAAFDTERSRCVRIDGEIAAMLYWFECSYEGERVAYIYAVATSKQYRGRGLGSALMKDTHRHLASIGYKGAVLVPGNSELFRFYERLGYVTCGYVSEFDCIASDVKAELTQLDADEYARLRRAFLPKGSVVQERENIKFLEAQVGLYAGDGFLLAARRDKDTLYGVELLGDTQSAPSVVSAFGCSIGHFRTHGDDKPFAMYYDLSDARLLPPSYFGLAFD